jgi:hypothetical protein
MQSYYVRTDKRDVLRANRSLNAGLSPLHFHFAFVERPACVLRVDGVRTRPVVQAQLSK